VTSTVGKAIGLCAGIVGVAALLATGRGNVALGVTSGLVSVQMAVLSVAFAVREGASHDHR
jgi:hypothetical protein